MDGTCRTHIQPIFFMAVKPKNTKVVAELIARGADHLHSDLRTGYTTKQIARVQNDADMLRTLDLHKSEYFAFGTDWQRSEDYASATSSPATTPLSTVHTPLATPPNSGPDFSKPALRPRPRTTG